MSQFNETQMATVKAAIEFLAEFQMGAHSHVAEHVQEVLDLFKPMLEEKPAEETPVEEVPAKKAFSENEAE